MPSKKYETKLRREFHQGLESGQPPACFFEEAEILREGEYAAATESYILSLIDKLPKKHIQTQQIKVYLSIQSDPNAYVIPDSTPKIMVVTKGLLDLAKSEDELLGIISHELMHLDLAAEFPDLSGSSKVEESVCDLSSIHALHEAEYRVDGIVSIFKRFPKGSESPLAKLFDPHPSMPLRIKDTSSVIDEFFRERGVKLPPEKPLPTFILEGRGQSQPCLHPVEKELSGTAYTQANSVEKMRILTRLLQAEDPEIFHKENEDLFSKRRKLYYQALAGLDKNLKISDQAQAFGALLDQILQMTKGYDYQSSQHNALNALYQGIPRARGDGINYPPYGSVAQLSVLGHAFERAENKEEAHTCARELNLVLQHPALHGRLQRDFSDLDFFTITPPKRSLRERFFNSPPLAPELPWNKHLLWSKNDPEIQRALGGLGVLSEIYHYYPAEEKTELGYDPLPLIVGSLHLYITMTGGKSVNMSPYEYRQGRLVPKKSEILFPFTAEAERLRLAKKDEAAKALDIDWELLRKEPPTFVERYLAGLCYEATFVDGGYYLAEQVLAKIAEWSKLPPPEQKEEAKTLLAYARAEVPPSPEEILKSVLWELRYKVHHPKFNQAIENYDLGVSPRHPFIQYAIQHFENPAQYLPSAIFYYVNRDFYYQHSELRSYGWGEALLSSYPSLIDSIATGIPLVLTAECLSYLDLLVARMTDLRDRIYRAAIDKIALTPLELRWCFYEYEKIYQLERGEREVWVIPQAAKAYPFTNLFKLPTHSTPWLFEAYRIFTHNPELLLSPDDYAYMASYAKDRRRYEKEPELTKRVRRDEIEEGLLESFRRYEQNYFERSLQEKNPLLLSKYYHLFVALAAPFDNYANIRRYEKHYREVCDSLGTKAEQKLMLDALLLPQKLEFPAAYSLSPITCRKKFVHPDFKNWLIERYSQVLTASLEEEKTVDAAIDSPVLASLKKELDQVMDQAPLGVAIPVLRQVLDLMRAQRAIAYHVRDRIRHSSAHKLLKEGISLGALGEYLVTEIPKATNPYLRLDTLSFMMGDKDFNLHGYILGLMKLPYSTLHYSFEHPTVIEGAKNASKAALKRYEANPEYYQEQMRLLRMNYEDLSLEQQVVVMDQFLFPASNPVPMREVKTYVLDRLFGSSLLRGFANVLTGQSVQKTCSDPEARQIVEAYLEALELIAEEDPRYQTLRVREEHILAALLVAQSRSNKDVIEGAPTNRGEALRQVLEAMGPAGRKLAQAVESHSETPRDIKAALKDSKTNAAPPARWEIHEWIEKTYPEEKEIVSVGERLGSGSYAVTVVLNKKNGQESAVSLLRPFVAAQAEQEFMILNRAAGILIAKNKAFQPIDDMQREAAISSIKEVDMDVAVKQQRIAEKLYHGLEVVVDGQHFKFGVAQWIGHAAQHKETTVVLGTHFNDLDQDPALRDLKGAAAFAILAVELFLLFKGGPIDNDRHGGQQKLRRMPDGTIYVGNFDFGGLMLFPQTEWQKDLLGQLLGEALWKHSFYGQAFDGQLISQLGDKYEKQFAALTFTDAKGKQQPIGNDKAQHYVGGLKRSILALGNYLDVIENEPGKLQQLIATLFSTGQVDKTIEAGVRKQLGRFAYKLDELKTESKETQIIAPVKPK